MTLRLAAHTTLCVCPLFFLPVFVCFLLLRVGVCGGLTCRWEAVLEARQRARSVGSEASAARISAGGGMDDTASSGGFHPFRASPLTHTLPAVHSPPSGQSLRPSTGETVTGRFSVDAEVVSEANSSADAARDILDTVTPGHTWHGHVATERWRRFQADRERSRVRDDHEDRQWRHRVFARLAGDASDEDGDDVDEDTVRELASSMDVADDLLGTAGAARRQRREWAVPAPRFAGVDRGDAYSSSLPRAWGTSSQRWGGGYASPMPSTATATPTESPGRVDATPPRTPRSLAALFGGGAADETSSAAHASSATDDGFVDTADNEQRWRQAMAARPGVHALLGRGSGQHTWHGAETHHVEAWQNVLRTRQEDTSVSTSHDASSCTKESSSFDDASAAPPACGR
eukprot:m.88663 g.88663  ORF g.88663 m.88663 type:complete len:402 (+) comp9769_c0_seq2:293-1498(+)